MLMLKLVTIDCDYKSNKNDKCCKVLTLLMVDAPPCDDKLSEKSKQNHPRPYGEDDPAEPARLWRLPLCDSVPHPPHHHQPLHKVVYGACQNGPSVHTGTQYCQGYKQFVN